MLLFVAQKNISCKHATSYHLTCVIFFSILDFGGNGSEGEILGLENMLRICLFFNHVSLIMVISSSL